MWALAQVGEAAGQRETGLGTALGLAGRSKRGRAWSTRRRRAVEQRRLRAADVTGHVVNAPGRGGAWGSSDGVERSNSSSRMKTNAAADACEIRRRGSCPGQAREARSDARKWIQPGTTAWRSKGRSGTSGTRPPAAGTGPCRWDPAGNGQGRRRPAGSGGGDEAPTAARCSSGVRTAMAGLLLCWTMKGKTRSGGGERAEVRQEGKGGDVA